jgi:hypothetical protein
MFVLPFYTAREMSLQLASFNPYSNKQGQSWPQLLCIKMRKTSFKNTYSCRNFLRIFFTSDKTSKYYVLAYILTIDHNKFSCTATPPFCLVLLLFQTTQGHENLWHNVVCGLIPCQPAFQYISDLVPGWVQGVAGPQLGLLSSSF